VDSEVVALGLGVDRGPALLAFSNAVAVIFTM